MKTTLAVFAWALLFSHAILRAEAVKDREGAVRNDRESMLKDIGWIYNDIDGGFAEAAKTGKPLLVVLRCVPCKACMGIDASILSSKELRPLLDKFVCVRVINANALDLGKFQFDYDLSFSTLIFNADGTLYGRYGSWRHQRDMTDSTTQGYKATLEAALEVHKGFPGNKATLAGKQGGPAPFKIPIEIPDLAGKYERELNWGGQVVKSCVHCHQIGDAFRTWYRGRGQTIPADLIYPMPAPETVGFSLDAEHAAHVEAVTPGTAAATAGLQAGDDIATVDGQPLLSIADFSWCLHRAPETGALKLGVRRAGEAKELTLALAEGWRLKSDISTRHGTWPMRAMATGGMQLTELSDADRAKRGIDPNGLALVVKFLGASGPWGAAKAAGFQKDDVLVAVEGIPSRATESELIGRLLLAHPGKAQVKTTVMRGEKKIDLLLPMQ
jgi:hypothetical protein